MITALYLGWTDSATKQWFPLQKLTWSNGKYYMIYLQGMLDAMKISVGKRTLVNSGLAKLDRVKITKELPEDFRKRMPVNRPYTDVEELARLGLPNNLRRFNPIEYVARNGLCNLNYELCGETTPDKYNVYHFYFGTNDLPGIETTEYIQSHLQVGDLLDLKSDHIYHRGFLLGLAPSYVADLLNICPKALSISVAQINRSRFRFDKVLCHISMDGNIATPFSDCRYQPLVDIKTELAV